MAVLSVLVEKEALWQRLLPSKNRNGLWSRRHGMGSFIKLLGDNFGGRPRLLTLLKRAYATTGS